MKALRLTLLCHSGTAAQVRGRFPTADDPALALTALPSGEFDRIVSAPELRARHTAQAFGDFDLEPTLADCDLGRWVGQAIKDLQRQAPDAFAAWLDDPDFDGHGGERFTQMGVRVGTWLERMSAQSGRWLAVTHPWAIRLALAQVLGLSHTAAQVIDVRPGGHVVLTHSDRWRLAVG